MGIIQPDLVALYRSIAKEIATLALALATTTTTTKEKPEYENMVKHYIVASVLLGSMLAGHAHAVTAPHDAGLRKLLDQEDGYGDQYDPYGVDTDDDYYSSNDGYFYAYPDSYDDDYGDQYDAYGVDYDDDYYASNDGYFYRYPIGAGYEISTPSIPSFDSLVDSAVDAGGNAASEYIDNDCTGESVADHTCQLFGGADAVNDLISDGIQDTIVSGVSSLFGRRLLQDNYGDQYDPYGVDTDDDYYDGGDGYFYRYPAAAVGGVVDTVVDTAGSIVSNTATSAFETVTGGLLGGKETQ